MEKARVRPAFVRNGFILLITLAFSLACGQQESQQGPQGNKLPLHHQLLLSRFQRPAPGQPKQQGHDESSQKQQRPLAPVRQSGPQVLMMGRLGGRPVQRFPPYKAICKLLKNPTFVDQQVQCALDPEGDACSKGVAKHLQGISVFLRDALPAAAGRATCDYCTQDDYEKIQFIAKYMLRFYPHHVRALVLRYSAEIAAYAKGGIGEGFKTWPNVPEKCPE